MFPGVVEIIIIFIEIDGDNRRGESVIAVIVQCWKQALVCEW